MTGLHSNWCLLIPAGSFTHKCRHVIRRQTPQPCNSWEPHKWHGGLGAAIKREARTWMVQASGAGRCFITGKKKKRLHVNKRLHIHRFRVFKPLQSGGRVSDRKRWGCLKSGVVRYLLCDPCLFLLLLWTSPFLMHGFLYQRSVGNKGSFHVQLIGVELTMLLFVCPPCWLSLGAVGFPSTPRGLIVHFKMSI